MSSLTKPKISTLWAAAHKSMAAARFPSTSRVSSSSTWGKWGRHAHGWSAAPLGPARCGLCLTSDSRGSQPGCAPLPFSGPFHFYSNNVELQEEAGTALYLHQRFMRHSCFLLHQHQFPQMNWSGWISYYGFYPFFSRTLPFQLVIDTFIYFQTRLSEH